MKAIDVFTTRLFNRLDAYYVWDDYLGRYDAKRKPVTPELVRAHLNHSLTLCIPALNVDGYSQWGGWDSDRDNDDLDRIEKVLVDLGWYPLREARRSGRQGHSWLFFDVPVKAADLRLFNKAIRKRAGVTMSEDELEFFPKQDIIVPNGMGNGLRLPLGKNRKPDADGAVGWFESCRGRTIQGQLDWFCIQPLNPGKKIAEIAHTVRVDEAARKVRRYYKSGAFQNKGINFIDHATSNSFKQRGEQLVGPCPSCRTEGHDSNGDHLSIHANKNLVHCWRGCSFTDIIQAIKFEGQLNGI